MSLHTLGPNGNYVLGTGVASLEWTSGVWTSKASVTPCLSITLNLPFLPSMHICILKVIKYWRWWRPVNEANWKLVIWNCNKFKCDFLALVASLSKLYVLQSFVFSFQSLASTLLAQPPPPPTIWQILGVAKAGNKALVKLEVGGTKLVTPALFQDQVKLLSCIVRLQLVLCPNSYACEPD